jgi:hypothetical protein
MVWDRPRTARMQRRRRITKTYAPNMSKR